MATAFVARAADNKQSSRLPGPLPLPFLGTRWLFWSRYKMNKLHEAYEGKRSSSLTLIIDQDNVLIESVKFLINVAQMQYM